MVFFIESMSNYCLTTFILGAHFYQQTKAFTKFVENQQKGGSLNEQLPKLGFIFIFFKPGMLL